MILEHTNFFKLNDALKIFKFICKDIERTEVKYVFFFLVPLFASCRTLIAMTKTKMGQSKKLAV